MSCRRNGSTFINYGENVAVEKQIISACNKTPQVIPNITNVTPATPNIANVLFPVLSIQKGITTNTSTGEFTINVNGYYSVQVGIVVLGVAQFGIYINGILSAGTPFQAVEGAVLLLNKGDILTVRNTTTAGNVTTVASVGLNPAVTAGIIMFKIN